MLFNEVYMDTLGAVARAVLNQDIQLLQELLQSGHSTNAIDNRGWTPLHVAASEGCVEAVRHLLTADDVNVESLTHDGLTPLYFACTGKMESHKKVVELLLRAEADPDMASGDNWVVPLHAATENNNVEVVRMLLDAGGDPNLLAFKSTTALHSAAGTGALEAAQLLLERGGDLNIGDKTMGHSALHCLCYHYQEELGTLYNNILDLFLSHNCDINAVDNDGTTALMLALQVRWDWAVDRLLEHDADVHLIKTDCILALHFAVQFSGHSKGKSTREGGEEQEDSSSLKKILSRTSLDKIPRDGFSVFHLAIQWKRLKGLREVIESGLDPDEFLQDMEGAIIDRDEKSAVPLIVEIDVTLDSPLGYLLYQSLTREVVDTAKYMIDKGSCINALKPGVLPPLVATLKNRYAGAYEADGLGQEILQYLLARGADIMHKTREGDLIPDALVVSSLFNVEGFFRLLQHGVPAQQIYAHDTLAVLMQYYEDMQLYNAIKEFPWLVVSWLGTANLFITQLPLDTVDIFDTEWNVSDENLTQAWQQLRDVIASPKSLQQLCVLKVRHVLGEGRGWEKLQDSLNQLQTYTRLPDPILDMLYFRWVKLSTLKLRPPDSARNLYATTPEQHSSDEEQ